MFDIYKVYTRVKDQNIIPDGIVLKIWKYQNNKQNVKVTFTNEEMFLLRYLNENKKITVKEFIQKAEISKKEAERIIVNFTLMNLLKYEITEKELFFSLSAALAAIPAGIIHTLIRRLRGKQDGF